MHSPDKIFHVLLNATLVFKELETFVSELVGRKYKHSYFSCSVRYATLNQDLFKDFQQLHVIQGVFMTLKDSSKISSTFQDFQDPCKPCILWYDLILGQIPVHPSVCNPGQH